MNNKDGKDNSKYVQFYGQEKVNQTYNLARMNMILHRVPSEFQHLNYGDTLGADWPTDEPTNFDAVVMNPPYSSKWTSADSYLTDQRFARYERLAPKSAAVDNTVSVLGRATRPFNEISSQLVPFLIDPAESL